MNRDIAIIDYYRHSAMIARKKNSNRTNKQRRSVWGHTASMLFLVSVAFVAFGIVAVGASPVHAASASEEENGAASGPPALREAVSKLANDLTSETAPQEAMVLPAGSSELTGYAASTMAVFLQRYNWKTRPDAGEEPLQSMRAPELPDQLAEPLRTAFDGGGQVVLVAAEKPGDEVPGSLGAALYKLKSGEKVASAAREYTLSELQFLASTPNPGWKNLDRIWYKLLLKLFRKFNPAEFALEGHLELAEGYYFFRAGYFAKAAERLGGYADDSPNGLFLRLIMALHLSGQTEKADKLLQSALEVHADSGPLYALKVWRVREKDMKDAVVLLGHARFSDVKNEGYYWCARGLIALEEDNDDRAERVLLKAAEALPDDSFIQMQVAEFYWDNAKLERAIKYYRKALDADPENAEAWYELAMAQDTTGQADKAIETLRRAFSLDPGRPHVSKRLSLLLERRGRYHAALEVLREAASANPLHVDILSTYGDCAAHQWRLDEAAEAYRNALKADPEFTYAKVRLAEIRSRQSKWKEAEKTLRGILEKNPEYVPAVVALGRLLTAQGHTQEAIELLTKGATNLDQEVSRRLALCEAYLQGGEASKAIRDAQIAVGARPGPQTYSMLARALIAAGELNKAEMAVDSALEAGSFSSEAHLARARVLRARDKIEEALKQCKKALELDPFSVDAMDLCGSLYKENTKPEKCADMWRQAIQLNRWAPELHWKMAELLRAELNQKDEAARHYKRHLELGGLKADRAARWLEKLESGDSE